MDYDLGGAKKVGTSDLLLMYIWLLTLKDAMESMHAYTFFLFNLLLVVTIHQYSFFDNPPFQSLLQSPQTNE